MSDDDQFIIVCPICGKPVDKRDLKAVLSHGWFNPGTGAYDCNVEFDIADDTIAMKKGDSVQWYSDGKRVDLN